MHGRPRAKGPEDPERTKAAKQKALLLGQLSQEVLSRRAARSYDEESLVLAAKLLELNPEVYTVWNLRREALQPVLDAGGAAAVAAAEQELVLTERALQRNPKSYSAWHHRKWVVGRRLTSLEAELRLVGMLLDADERNFHGWDYWRFTLQLMGTPAERALDFARKKIDQNFSNYSAWHVRTALLPVAHAPEREEEKGQGPTCVAAGAPAGAAGAPAGAGEAKKGGGGGGAEGEAGHGAGGRAAAEGADGAKVAGDSDPRPAALVPKDVLDEEYELVKQAFYTEPEDQSGWFYHRWLLGSSWAHWDRARGSEREAEEREALLTVVLREQAMCQDLVDIEPDSKWPLLTMARLKEMQLQLLSATAGAAGEAGTAAGAAAREELGREVREIYATLAEVDPMRAGYYGDALAGRASVVMAPLAAGRLQPVS